MAIRTDRGNSAQAHHFNLDQLRALQAEQADVEATLVELRRECRNLETRCEHLRSALAQGEIQRRFEVPTTDVVALVDVRGRDASEYFAQLQLRERDLIATEREQTAMRTELERRAAVLHDDRAVLAEQTALLLQARSDRFAAEAGLVQELESLAIQLLDREVEQANADAVRLDRAQQLWTLHNRLEARQTQLTLTEQSVRHAAERLEAEAEPQRRQLAEREQALTVVGQEWAALRREELRRNRECLERRDAEAIQQRLATAELDEKQTELLTEAAAVAAEAHALEKLRRDLDPTAKRKLDDVKAKWEHRLNKVKAELDRRRTGLDALTATAAEQLRRAAVADSEASGREAERTATRQAEPLERAERMTAINARLAEIEVELRRGTEAKRDAALMHDELNRLTTMLATLPPPTLHEAPFGESLVLLRPAG